jgi:hypothetical protein
MPFASAITCCSAWHDEATERITGAERALAASREDL